MPKRVLSKVGFIAPQKSEKERKRLFQQVSEENLPLSLWRKVLSLACELSSTSDSVDSEGSIDGSRSSRFFVNIL